MRLVELALFLGCAGAGCFYHPVGGAADTGHSTGGAAGSSGTAGGPTTGMESSTGGATSSTSASTAGSTGSSAGSTGTTAGGTGTTATSCPGFVCAPDLGDPWDQDCSLWEQDCPPGGKCNSADKGSGTWDGSICVPLAPDPDQVGEPCTVEGDAQTGHDSCEKGAICWDVDVQNEGVCVAMCKGSPDRPTCDEPGEFCMILNNGSLILCIPMCDPLMQDCPDGEVCVPNPGDTDVFICALDASGDEGQVFDMCEFANVCDPGLMCASPSFAVECDPMVLGCCLPFCDTTAANSCPGAMQECVPWYEMGQAPVGLGDVGICALPQ